VLDNVFVPLAEEFQPQVILMVDGSDTHFSDRITDMGLTLKGIYMIADKVRQTAEKVCQGKVIAFDGSGYDAKGVLFPRGWLTSICGLTGMEINLEEPYPVPAGHRRDFATPETKVIVQATRAKLAPYWKCFAS
jgi:acetoin utilization deacetylase AcuC-like enzyme